MNFGLIFENLCCKTRKFSGQVIREKLSYKSFNLMSTVNFANCLSAGMYELIFYLI